jgi:hypothetical protein
MFHTTMLQNASWCQITLHYTCILTETIKIYQEKCVGLKKNPIMISPYTIFEVNKLLNDEIF